MAGLNLKVRGALREHPIAATFAREVGRVHARYAAEVVARYQLCPFLRDPATGFGQFCVMLDHTLDPDGARDAVVAAAPSNVHLVYPLVKVLPPVFERFAADLYGAVRKAMPDAPVLAAFHPELSGDGSNPGRLVGLLRRAPDPFVQFIPPGLTSGGTVFAGTTQAPRENYGNATHARLAGAPLEALLATLAAIHEDRRTSYARYLAILG